MNTPRIAVLGGGLSTTVAANILANKGINVDIFEAGRGLGGRTATRRIDNFLFDHGASYFSKPKTLEFRDIIHSWKEKGWVKPWQGTFGTLHLGKDLNKGTIQEIDEQRFVSVPQMNYLCKNIASHKNIQCHFQNKMKPIIENDNLTQVKWKLNGMSKDVLFEGYDWVIIGDRSIADIMIKSLPLEKDFRYQRIIDLFAKPMLSSFLSVPTVTLMMVFPEIPKNIFPFDHIFVNKISQLSQSKDFVFPENSHWIKSISRESSKPERSNAEGKEAWVIQSTSEFASLVMQKVAEMPDDSSLTFEQRKERVNDLTQALLPPVVCSFFKAVANYHNIDNANAIDKIVNELVFCKAHRWSASFPSLKVPLADILDHSNYLETGQGRCYVDPISQFAACGDYLVESDLVGTLEGATLSGKKTADAILNFLAEKKE